MSDKIIVTSWSRLKRKYGAIRPVAEAVKRMVAADQTRGIRTTVVRLDDRAQMQRYGGSAVSPAGRARQCKAAIDAVYRTATPDYLMILGATDVVPHVPIANTMPDDGDAYAHGDIPYACDSPYGTDPATYAGPTRVVGRLPDLVGGRDAAFLVGLIDTAAGSTSRSRRSYARYFGITADVWRDSTALSLERTFGNDRRLKKSPPDGPTWPRAELTVRSYFVNCHGAEADPHFYGEKGSRFPVALAASDLAAKGPRAGAVASVECCYGAELYDPALAQGEAGICTTFLRKGGYGFFGSTTIAYGPAAGNGAADLITQYFLQAVLAGASLGRAALEARQRFVQGAGTMNPVDLKTLAQFILLGDPSVHPVERSETHSPAADRRLMKGVAPALINLEAHRVNRRRQLIGRGLALLSSAACARLAPSIAPSASVARALRRMASNLRLRHVATRSFQVVGGGLPKAVYAKAAPARVYHLIHGERRAPSSAPAVPRVAIVAEERDGKIISVREYYRR